MTIDEVVQMLNASHPKPLTKLQEWLLRQAWEGKTYSSMAIEANYVEEYLRRTASGLWSLLSDAWGEPITKTNFRSILEPRRLTIAQRQLIEDFSRSVAPTPPEFPSGPLSLDSSFYIPRPPIEELAYEEIAKPGSAIRIKAPRRQGKSSLMLRIIAHAATLNYCTANIDFQQADSSVFANLDKFLRWLSANVSRELQLESKLEDYWDEEIGSKVSCTLYFQAYLLERLVSPLVLTLNEVNRVFEYPDIARDFLPLLRFWHEQSRKLQIWQKLRMVVAYSTEIYIPLNLNQSPFNIGLPLKLPPFTIEQVLDLARRYGLDWTDGSRAKRLMAMVGGHPYLLQLAFYHLWRGDLTLKQLLDGATSASGIYSEHLRQLLGILQEDSKLEAAFRQALASTSPVRLEPIFTYKLDSMGLVNHVEGDRVTPSCELYRLYFREQLFPADELKPAEGKRAIATMPDRLETKNQGLQLGVNLDEFTGIANRHYFNTYLQNEWQCWATSRTTLTLILCEIDYFKTYNDIYGATAGEQCLRQIAIAIDEAIESVVKTHEGQTLVARYGGDEFAVILSSIDFTMATKIAETIRAEVKKLAIATNNLELKIDGFPDDVVTVSVGGASTIAASDRFFSGELVRAAEKALYQSKRKGRDCITFSSILNEK